jgi:flagellar basal body-associated protein FliL
MGTNGLAIGILIFLLILVIVYIIVMFEMYKNKKFIFTPYVQPTPPNPSFYPLGSVTPMTADEIAQRNAIIQASRNAAT